MWINNFLVFSMFHAMLIGETNTEKRQRRYLIFTPSTQWGVFLTISIPLPHPESLVSVAWFFEANYYNVDNATYLQPLLGDVDIGGVRKQRGVADHENIFTRRGAYSFIESMLAKHGYPGHPCLLRAICESSSQFQNNGILGDLLQFILTPSSSQQEDIDDSYYEAEYWGLENRCEHYIHICPENPLDNISVNID